MTRQYVAVRFGPLDQRSYTYHHDGEPLAVGDMCLVETKRGTAKVEVVHLPDEPPPFETKAIIGRAPVEALNSSEENEHGQ